MLRTSQTHGSSHPESGHTLNESAGEGPAGSASDPNPATALNVAYQSDTWIKPSRERPYIKRVSWRGASRICIRPQPSNCTECCVPVRHMDQAIQRAAIH